MKASEVLTRYAAGERNFQRLNLRGQSFKGKDLSGADFSEADLYSTNFTGANLKGANFTGAKCGLLKSRAILWFVFYLLLAGISGFTSIFFALSVLSWYDNNLANQFNAWSNLIVIVIFMIVTIQKGTFAGAVTGVFLVVIIGTLELIFIPGFIVSSLTIGTGLAFLGAVTTTVTGALGVGVGVGVAGAREVKVIGAVSVTGAVALGIAVGVFAHGGAMFEYRKTLFLDAETLFLVEVAFLGAVALGVGVYIGWLAMNGVAKYAWVHSLSIAFTTIGGTSFRGADLTDANISYVRLKSTDMRDATLTRVRWYGAKMLDRVRTDSSYLQNTQIKQWLTGKGNNKNFDGQKLQGINFQGADLTDASFIDANLNEANLQYADLSGAKLIQTQLDRTDLTGATLTGACIEDWGITTHTKLDNVKCEYIFMRSPTKEDPNPRRKPDNWEENFEGNDFADFVKPIFDTLDLYHNQGVDPRAIAISWKELAEKNPDAQLQFASMEVKGEDNLLLRLKTAPNADLSQLSADYFETYNQLKALAEAESRKLIAEKDNRIQALETMVNTALKRPGFYAENYNHQGDNEMAGDKYEQKGNFGIGHMSGGEIQEGAKVAGVINEAQKQNLADAAQEIQQLLEQLSKTYPTTTSKEKNIVVGEVIDRIENNPTLKAKVINALKAGGTEAFKEAIDHPLVNIFVATIEGWQDAE